ncbi:MAG: (d)CMP kinase [Candidatus Fimenecus sp.]
MKMINIAIDGPAGAGKSSVSKAVANRLGFLYIDTGALYRTIGFYFKINNFLPTNENIDFKLSNLNIELKYIDRTQYVFLNGENVSDCIRTPEISSYASKISAIKEVRAFLLNTQRDIANKNNCIMDGRDIGTVVLPNANLKIFLTASAEIRAKRRVLQLKENGVITEYNKILEEIIERDNRDMSREEAPLKQAKDAIFLDTSEMSEDEVEKKIIDLIKGVK